MTTAHRSTVVRNLLPALIALALAAGAAALWLRAPGEDTVTPSRVPVTPDPSDTPGTASAPIAPATPLPAIDAEVPLELDLRLVATVVRSDPSASFAALARRDGTDSELVGVGESISLVEGAHVVRVGEGFAVVGLGERRLRLSASSRLDPLAERFLTAVHAAPRRELEPAEQARRAAMAERLRARMDAGTEAGTRIEGDGLFAEGRARGHWDGDRLQSIEIDDIEPGGFYDAIGLQDGDRIVGINGIGVGEPDAAARILKEIVVADTLVADVEREAGSDAVHVPSEVVLDELRDRFSDLSAEDRAVIESLPFEPPDSSPEIDEG